MKFINDKVKQREIIDLLKPFKQEDAKINLDETTMICCWGEPDMGLTLKKKQDWKVSFVFNFAFEVYRPIRTCENNMKTISKNSSLRIRECCELPKLVKEKVNLDEKNFKVETDKDNDIILTIDYEKTVETLKLTNTKRRWEKVQECVICMQTAIDKFYITTCCKNAVFHLKCLYNYIYIHDFRKCPVCADEQKMAIEADEFFSSIRN